MKLYALENLISDMRKRAGETEPEVFFKDIDARGVPIFDVSHDLAPTNLRLHVGDNGDFYIPVCSKETAK